MPILRESKASNPGIMSHDELRPLRSVVLNPNLSFLQTRAHQHHRASTLRDRTQSLRVRNRLNLMQQLKIREVVDKDLLLEDDDDPIPPEPNGSNIGPEGELSDAPALVIVPDHDLVGRILRIGSAADEREYVASEEHLHDGDSAAAIEIAAENLAEGIAVEDAEAVVGADGEAGVVLVEGEVEERRERRLDVGIGIGIGIVRDLFGVEAHGGEGIEGLGVVSGIAVVRGESRVGI